MTGMIVTGPNCAPLLIDTCGGLELARQLKLVGFDRADLHAVIVTHRHLDHAGGIQDLLLARMPLEIYALPDTHEGIAIVTVREAFPNGSFILTLLDTKSRLALSAQWQAFGWSFLKRSIGYRRWPCASPRVTRRLHSAPTPYLATRLSPVPRTRISFFATPFARISMAKRLRRVLWAPCMPPPERLPQWRPAHALALRLHAHRSLR